MLDTRRVRLREGERVRLRSLTCLLKTRLPLDLLSETAAAAGGIVTTGITATTTTIGTTVITITIGTTDTIVTTGTGTLVTSSLIGSLPGSPNQVSVSAVSRH